MDWQMIIGYARTLSEDADGARQVAKLKEAGCERIVFDSDPGGRWDNVKLRQVLAQVSNADLVIVESQFSIANNWNDFLTFFIKLRKTGATFFSILDGIDTRTPEGIKVSEIICGFGSIRSQFQSLTTREGVERAREQGRAVGRPPKLDPIEKNTIRRLLRGNYMGVCDIAKMYKVHHSVISKVRREMILQT